MEESRIIELFYERSEQAITELSEKYGVLCHRIAENILKDAMDSEERVKDAYFSIPSCFHFGYLYFQFNYTYLTTYTSSIYCLKYH